MTGYAQAARGAVPLRMNQSAAMALSGRSSMKTIGK
jgi:hypothetical protein